MSFISSPRLTFGAFALHRRMLITCIACCIPLMVRAEMPVAEIESLMHALSSTNVEEVSAAIHSLSELGEAAEPAIPLLVELLADERELPHIELIPITFTISRNAEDALRSIGPPAISALAKFVAETKVDDARIKAIQIIWWIGVPSQIAQDALLPQARNENELIRAAVLQALPKISTKPAETVAVFTKALEDESSEVRGAAVQGLGNLGSLSASAVPKLLEMLEHEQGQRSMFFAPDAAGRFPVRADVIQALGKIGVGNEVLLAKLAQLMKSGEPELRVSAALAHCRLAKDPTVGLNVLVKEMNVRTAEALAQLGERSRPVTKELQNALNHPEPLVRLYAMRSLAAIHPTDIVDQLLVMYGDEEFVVREEVLELLGGLPDKDERILSTLMLGLDDRSWFVQMAAIDTLKSKGSAAQKAIPQLQKLADGEDDAIRKSSLEALRAIE